MELDGLGLDKGFCWVFVVCSKNEQWQEQRRGQIDGSFRPSGCTPKYAVRFNPVDRITFYTGIVRGLAPIRAELQSQMHTDDLPEG